MALSMHSHSGQFCPGHAMNTLEECVQAAISKGLHLFGLTEHMPRDSEDDLYPEEILAGDNVKILFARHSAYLAEAIQLRTKYRDQITIIIGFECEWIRPSYASLINQLATDPIIEYFIGSVHHVHHIPIDYNKQLYVKAREIAGGTDERLFEDYFDAQYDMLTAVRPRVIGHFDLIRLLSDRRNIDLQKSKGVWTRVLRNLNFIVERDSLLEVNSSGLRKGLDEPYPMRCVCEAFLAIGGKLTLSDDSHGIDQVAACYPQALEYMESLGLKEIWCLDRKDGEESLSSCIVSLQDIKESLKL
ncbi:putative histidinol-phosphatase [Golovinomyces cichoracearum]|uniref:Histidinol-phosphatase n=1 Tax=Golovinomyces cichoracearum TaxID=62708 RepID=A0A420HIJ1_9PEZI|nr:putative histidinol-phosphatase [Golovinomyces cichoracearum]